MEHLIDQIITLTRLDSETSIDTRRLDFSELLGRVVKEVEYESESVGISVHLDVEAGVEADVQEELIRRAIENVLRNAIAHSAPGDTIIVRLDHTNQITLSIADNGPGVPEDMLQRIFEPFVQVHEGRAHTGHSGIGLAIARSSVELHHGRIYAQPRKAAKGLEVIIELPLPT